MMAQLIFLQRHDLLGGRQWTLSKLVEDEIELLEDLKLEVCPEPHNR